MGTVFSIEEFSVYDGPGIRTTVFLKGCPLRCNWCHNPEGQLCGREIVRGDGGCLGCGECLKHAVLTDKRVIYTEESRSSCPKGLLRACGVEYEPAELVEKIMKNERFLNTGGGVTFSGGEPLMQSDFLFECLSLLSGKLHRAVQTSGYCDEKVFKRALENADHFLFDLKIADEEQHVRHTGKSNGGILKNFYALAKSGKDFTVRIPLIPSVTDTEANLDALAKIIKNCGADYAELLPYNTAAGAKYKMTGRKYEPRFDESRAVEHHGEVFAKYGIKAKIL